MDWLSKIFDSLTIKFCNRNRSPSTNVNAKSNQEKAAATAGPNSPIDMSEGKTTNHYHTRSKKALENEDSWRNLINEFSDDKSQRIADQLLDPLLLLKSQQEGRDIIQLVSQKFAAIDIASDATKTEDFIAARDQSIEAIKQLVHSKNSVSFCKQWMAIGKTLTGIKQAVNKHDEGMAKPIEVLPMRQFPRWLYALCYVLILTGSVFWIYLIYLLFSFLLTHLTQGC